MARQELLAATDAEIEDAIGYADPIVLRGLLYQLTGDEAIAAIPHETAMMGIFGLVQTITDPDHVALLRGRAAELLKAYRDAGAGDFPLGAESRLRRSLELAAGGSFDDSEYEMWLEQLGLDPMARGLKWDRVRGGEPAPERKQDFLVAVIGAGLGGYNAAVHLKNAGIPFVVIEKNSEAGGTWHENRYPGARLDTLSRIYFHIFGIDYQCNSPFSPSHDNARYFKWAADRFGLNDDIVFGTEVSSIVWDEATKLWEISATGPDGPVSWKANAVITAVGFLNRPNLPDFPGKAEFEGPSWHTARWPEGFDAKGKRIAVIGTGCTGYQAIPELALEAEHVTVFQRTPQWLFEVPGYRSPFPPQVNWLDRNFPFHTNFMRARACTLDGLVNLAQIDPDFDDPHAVSPLNKRAREASLAFLRSKLKDPALVEAMTPAHPVWSARAVVVDPEYSILDAIQQDHVTLVTAGIERIAPEGVVDKDGKLHAADVIVYATGFRATELLYPMTITGRGGQTLHDLWAKGGARAYLGCMVPGFPNLWSIYGPNTNGSLNVASFHEKMALYALQCLETLVLGNGSAVEVKPEAYWRYNELVDARNATKAWSDPRANNYYWTEHGRSAVMCPFYGAEMSGFLRKPDLADLEIS